MSAASDRIQRIGVHGVATLILDALGWKFREQHESDWGIDAIIEVAVNDVPTGRLMALQIKSGPSYFNEVSPSGDWILRGPKRHLSYWLDHHLPVLVVLFDTHTRCAYWVHVTQQTATFKPGGFRLDVPSAQILDSSSGHRLRRIAETWAPPSGDDWSRARNRIQQCRAEGVPVPPTATLWDRFAAHRSIRPQATGPVLTHRLPLIGDARAVISATAGSSDAPVPLILSDLRGTWSVPPDTTVFVCENQLVIHEAAARLGPRSRPLVCLSGFPGAAAEYLLLGLGFCGARLMVHTDHDLGGRRIYQNLFARTVDFEPWCPGPPTAPQQALEEVCLPHMLDDLRY